MSVPQQPTSHDLLQGKAALWGTERDFRVKNPYVHVLMSQSVYDICMYQALSDLSREVGGFIIGRVLDEYKGKRYVYAEHAIIAQHTRANEVRLTFTTKTQIDMFNKLETFYPGKQVVGWFHTHPNMSVFYSDYDVWLHSNFFSQPHQFGIVIAPIGHRNMLGFNRKLTTTAGFFVWQHDDEGQKFLDPNNYMGCVELGDVQQAPLVEWDNMQRRDVDQMPTLATFDAEEQAGAAAHDGEMADEPDEHDGEMPDEQDGDNHDG